MPLECHKRKFASPVTGHSPLNSIVTARR